MDVIKRIEPDPSEKYPMEKIDVSGIKRKFLDVPYVEGSTPKSQTLDLYLPDEGEGPFPLIIFVHGGAFLGGEKRDFQFLFFIDGIRRGYAVASLNHRLMDEAIFPEQVFDIKAAVRYLRANAAKYNLDPERFAISGASAGAYFASLVGTTAGIPAFEDLSMGSAEADSSVQAVIGLFGVYDHVMQSEFTENSPPLTNGKLPNFTDQFIGTNCRECPGLVSLTWPGSYVTKNCPPMLIEGGTSDQIVPYEASPALVEKINSVCGEGRAILTVMEGCLHGDPAYSTPESAERRFAFLDSIFMK